MEKYKISGDADEKTGTPIEKTEKRFYIFEICGFNCGERKMRRVRIIFKTHLDIGFTDLAVRVVERYFRDFIVEAVKTAEYFRRGSGAFRYRWTVGSWLIDEYFNRATEAERRFLEQAIADGDIVWHAMPFTTHTELLTRELLRDGLAISGGARPPIRTPDPGGKTHRRAGHTRGLIGPFTDAGVDFLHIGTNPAAGVCKVPPLFRWKDSRNREILVAYQPRYGELLTIPGFRPELSGLRDRRQHRTAHAGDGRAALRGTLRKRPRRPV